MPLSAGLICDATPTGLLSSLPYVEIEWSPTTLPTEGPVWVALGNNNKIRSYDVKRGRPSEFGHFQPGKMIVDFDNANLWLSPLQTTKPWYSFVVPEKRIRMLWSYGGVKYVAFDGFIDGYPTEYDIGRNPVVTVEATDGTKILAQADLPASMLEFAIGLDQPTHWWKLGESVGATVAADAGPPATQTPGVYPGSATLASTGLVTYDGGGTSASFIPPDALRVTGGLPTSTSWSIEMWIKLPAATGDPPYHPIFSTEIGVSLLFPLLTITTGNAPLGQLNVFVTTTTPASAGVQSAGRVDDNLPHHVVVTWTDATRTATVYLDGALVGSAVAASGSGAFQASREFRVGGVFLPDTLYTLTVIAQHIQVYDGPVLSAAQVAAHYNAGKNALTGDDTGSRLGRYLDFVGYPTIDRDIDIGASTLGAYEITGGPVIDAAGKLDDMEQGQFYFGLDAALSTKHTFGPVWRSRHAMLTATRSAVVQATFGDGGAGSGELPFVDVKPAYDEQTIYTRAEVGRTGGDLQVVDDAAARAAFFRRTYSKTGLQHQTDNQCYDQATWALARYKDPHERFETILVHPQDDLANANGAPVALMPTILGIEIGSRIRVKQRPGGPSTPTVESQDLILEGIHHSKKAGGPLVTELMGSPANTQASWILDDTTYSVLDSTTIPSF